MSSYHSATSSPREDVMPTPNYFEKSPDAEHGSNTGPGAEEQKESQFAHDPNGAQQRYESHENDFGAEQQEQTQDADLPQTEHQSEEGHDNVHGAEQPKVTTVALFGSENIKDTGKRPEKLDYKETESQIVDQKQQCKEIISKESFAPAIGYAPAAKVLKTAISQTLKYFDLGEGKSKETEEIKNKIRDLDTHLQKTGLTLKQMENIGASLHAFLVSWSQQCTQFSQSNDKTSLAWNKHTTSEQRTNVKELLDEFKKAIEKSDDQRTDMTKDLSELYELLSKHTMDRGTQIQSLRAKEQKNQEAIQYFQNEFQDKLTNLDQLQNTVLNQRHKLEDYDTQMKQCEESKKLFKVQSDRNAQELAQTQINYKKYKELLNKDVEERHKITTEGHRDALDLHRMRNKNMDQLRQKLSELNLRMVDCIQSKTFVFDKHTIDSAKLIEKPNHLFFLIDIIENVNEKMNQSEDESEKQLTHQQIFQQKFLEFIQTAPNLTNKGDLISVISYAQEPNYLIISQPPAEAASIQAWEPSSGQRNLSKAMSAARKEYFKFKDTHRAVFFISCNGYLNDFQQCTDLIEQIKIDQGDKMSKPILFGVAFGEAKRSGQLDELVRNTNGSKQYAPNNTVICDLLLSYEDSQGGQEKLKSFLATLTKFSSKQINDIKLQQKQLQDCLDEQEKQLQTDLAQNNNVQDECNKIQENMTKLYEDNAIGPLVKKLKELEANQTEISNQSLQNLQKAKDLEDTKKQLEDVISRNDESIKEIKVVLTKLKSQISDCTNTVFKVRQEIVTTQNELLAKAGLNRSLYEAFILQVAIDGLNNILQEASIICNETVRFVKTTLNSEDVMMNNIQDGFRFEQLKEELQISFCNNKDTKLKFRASDEVKDEIVQSDVSACFTKKQIDAVVTRSFTSKDTYLLDDKDFITIQFAKLHGLKAEDVTAYKCIFDACRLIEVLESVTVLRTNREQDNAIKKALLEMVENNMKVQTLHKQTALKSLQRDLHDLTVEQKQLKDEISTEKENLEETEGELETLREKVKSVAGEVQIDHLVVMHEEYKREYLEMMQERKDLMKQQLDANKKQEAKRDAADTEEKAAEAQEKLNKQIAKNQKALQEKMVEINKKHAEMKKNALEIDKEKKPQKQLEKFEKLHVEQTNNIKQFEDRLKEVKEELKSKKTQIRAIEDQLMILEQNNAVVCQHVSSAINAIRITSYECYDRAKDKHIKKILSELATMLDNISDALKSFKRDDQNYANQVMQSIRASSNLQAIENKKK